VAREIHKKNVTRIDYAVGKSAVAAIADDDKVAGETDVFLGTSKDQLNLDCPQAILGFAVVAACSPNVNINLVEPIMHVAGKYGGGNPTA
jgi:hypothetical protein